MSRLYVYYRVRADDADEALTAFVAARADAGVELLRRPELKDGLMTWMEVYPARWTGCEPRIAKALQPWVQGERHIEHFDPLA